MSVKKKHHYIPQFYIKGFNDKKDNVFVLDKSTKKINKQSKNGTFHKYKFYTVDFNKHKQRSYESAKEIRKQLGLEKADTTNVIEYPDMILADRHSGKPQLYISVNHRVWIYFYRFYTIFQYS